LNAWEALLQLEQWVNIVHFAEAGMLAETALVDIALVEGSINTNHDVQRIREVRANSRYLITIGACATSGGVMHWAW